MNLLDLISADVALTKRGQDYWGHCPKHTDKTPSFSVSPDKELFYCFSCAWGGDAIQWLRDYRGLSYPEACKVVGKELTGPPPRPRSVEDRLMDDVEAALNTLFKEYAMLRAEVRGLEPGDVSAKLDCYIKARRLERQTETLRAACDQVMSRTSAQGGPTNGTPGTAQRPRTS